MLINQVYERLRVYLISILNDSTISVIYANQIEAPRPKKPFITLSIGQITNESLPMRYATDNLGLQNTLLNKSFLVTMESYADVLHQAEEILEKAEDYLRTEIAYNIFKGEISYMNTVLGVSSIPHEIGGINESRAILEVQFNLTKVVIDNVGLIEHIHITDLDNNKEIIINK